MCRCLCVSSYKEESDDATESDDLIEVEWTEADYEREAAETIEKVLRHRFGRKGGTLLTYSPSLSRSWSNADRIYLPKLEIEKMPALGI